MNDDLNNFDVDGLCLDSSTGNLFYNGSLLKYQPGVSYDTLYDVGGEIVVDETSQLRKLLDNLKNTEAEEYIDIVIEFLRKRLEKVLDNPDMVDSLDNLRNLAERVLYLETEVDSLRASLSNVTTKLDKLLEILKNGQEELKYL